MSSSKSIVRVMSRSGEVAQTSSAIYVNYKHDFFKRIPFIFSASFLKIMMINYGIGQTMPHGPGRMITYQQMKGTDNPGLIIHL